MNRLLPKVRGDNKITGTEIIDRIQIRDRGSERKYNSFDVDDLAADHFTNQLAEIDEINAETAEQLIDRYSNPRTVSWAVSNDTYHLENELSLEPEEVFKQLGETGLYRTEAHAEAGVLKPPEGLTEAEPSETESKDNTTQSGLSDF